MLDPRPSLAAGEPSSPEGAAPGPDGGGPAALRAELERLTTGRGEGAPAPDEVHAGLLALDAALLRLERAQAASARGLAGAAAPVRGAAAEWREALARAGLAAEAAEAERLCLALDLARLRATSLAAEGRGDGALAPAEAFQALLATEELLATYDGRPRGLAPEPGVVDAAAVVAEGRAARRELRARLAAAVADGAVQPALRERWVELGIDAADEAFFAAGEAPPHVAAERLDRAADALGWHAQALLAPGDAELARRLRRARGRLEAEREEQLLTALLARRFGPRNVARWERAVLAALLLVMGLLAFELLHGATRWSQLLDHGLCAFFLWDFTVRGWLIGFRRRWMARHLVTDFLPALPWAWLLGGGAGAADPARAGWLLRLLRLPRMARTLRVLMPVLRLARAVGFLARGLDRLVRSHGRLLEQELLLFPTSAERRAAARRGRDAEHELGELRTRLEQRLAAAVAPPPAGAAAPLGGSEAARHGLARRRLEQLAAAAPRAAPLGTGAERRPRRAARPLVEDVLARLERLTAGEVEAELGDEGVRRAARGVRMFARSPLRHAPPGRSWTPREALDLPDREVVAGAVRAVARWFARQHERVHWWADLATTITPAEAVGRVGATLVARTARPAVRLLVVAGLYGALLAVMRLVGTGELLTRLARMTERMIGTPLYVLGGVCLALLAVGAWLQRLARDASTFQDQVAAAQFLHLTDSIKARHRREDARFLARRVFVPELALRGDGGAHGAAGLDPVEALAERFVQSMQCFEEEGDELGAAGEACDPIARAVLLYRDHQDGALLGDSDVRATGQLLGNLALRRLIERSGRLCARDLQLLARIDLVRRRTLVSGPYVWFHAITRSLAARSARLIVEFNAHAIPAADLAHCTPEEARAYEAWLAEGRVDPGARQLTTAFTVLHFLDASPARDAEVERRFGRRVRARLEHARVELVRSVLGCWPLAYRPLEDRVLNLRAVYDRWLAGGRVVLLPLRLGWRGARAVAFLSGRLVEAVQVIRHPERPLGVGRPRQADFATALRKLDRMRVPAAWEALRLRARFDPEYLGFGRVDGADAVSADQLAVARDLAFLRAPAELEEEIERLRERTARDLERLARLLAGGLRARLEATLGVRFAADPERERALWLAFHADLDGVRAHLCGDGVVLGAAREALGLSLGPAWWVRPGLRRRFARWWRERGAPQAGRGDARAVARLRRAAWVAVSRDLDGARAALEACAADAGAAALRGEQRLAALLRHPGQLSEQLTTLRTIQTTTLLDVRSYRAHVHALGRYEADDPAEEWRPYLTLPG